MDSANHKTLQTLIILAIFVVSLLFVYSMFNPVEKQRKSEDELTIRTIQSLGPKVAVSSRCFRPVSLYYKSDPRAIYDIHGNQSFGGYLCL